MGWKGCTPLEQRQAAPAPAPPAPAPARGPERRPLSPSCASAPLCPPLCPLRLPLARPAHAAAIGGIPPQAHARPRQARSAANGNSRRPGRIVHPIVAIAPHRTAPLRPANLTLPKADAARGGARAILAPQRRASCAPVDEHSCWLAGRGRDRDRYPALSCPVLVACNPNSLSDALAVGAQVRERGDSHGPDERQSSALHKGDRRLEYRRCHQPVQGLKRFRKGCSRAHVNRATRDTLGFGRRATEGRERPQLAPEWQSER